MRRWSLGDARQFFEEKFCNTSSHSYLALQLNAEPQEILPGTIYHFDVSHPIYMRCTARLYCGLAHELGGRLWLQEAQSLVRLSAKRHPALPRVREGIFLEADGVGLVLSEASGYVLSPEDVIILRAQPSIAFRYLNLAADAVRVLHSHALIHRDIWRGSFETVVDEQNRPPYLRLFGFEMSAFAASLVDPSSRTSESDRAGVRAYRTRGGAEQFACRAPEVVVSEFHSGSPTLTYKSDIFALGICAYQWFIGDLPLDLVADYEDAPIEASARLLRFLGDSIASASTVPLPLRELLKRMVRSDMTSRPTATDVLNDLARIQDNVNVVWSTTHFSQPYVVSIAPRLLQQYLLIEEWKNLAADDELLFAQLQDVIGRDLVNSILIHLPTGAERYVRGGDRRSLRDSVWVLIGKRAVYFCQVFMARKGLSGATQLDWLLHINYIVDRCNGASVRDISCSPLRRRIFSVRVVHYTKGAEVDPRTGRNGNPSWAPLLDEVMVPPAEFSSHTSLCKAFEWWLSIQRAGGEVRQYAFQKDSNHPSSRSGRAVRLVWDRERDQRWIERDDVRHLISSRGRKRPEFGNFFSTLFDRDLGEEVTWESDLAGLPDRLTRSRSRGRVKRISAHEIEVEVIEGDPPPALGWLRPLSDVPTEIQLQRQVQAVAALFEHPELMQALYDPKSFRGPKRQWAHAGEKLLGRAGEIIQDMLACFPFYALQGPPGTGKTTLVAHAVAAYLRAKPSARILISAQSHYALDELASRILEVSQTDGRQEMVAVRLAGQHSLDQVREPIQAYLDANQAQQLVHYLRNHQSKRLGEWRAADSKTRAWLPIVEEWVAVAEQNQWELQDRIWRGANVVFATCGTCEDKILGIEGEFDIFDWVIVEEAAKAWPAELVMPLVFGHRWTLIGDHQQLPPFGDLEVKKLYEACLNSTRPSLRQLVDDSEPFRAMLELFRHLFDPDAFRVSPNDPGNEAGTSDQSRQVYGVKKWPVERLDMQFRMNEAIALLISRAFYPDVDLKTAAGLRSTSPMHGLSRPECIKERALVWLDTGCVANCRHESGQWSNDGEVEVVSRFVRALHPPPLADASSRRLAVLSPYNQQNQLLRSRLPAGASQIVHTTDSFQGREADIIIVSLVRTNDMSAEDPFRRIGHLASPQRTNVLLSRAKHLLVIVGDFDHFRATPNTPWPKICDDVQTSGGRIKLESLEAIS